MFSDIYNELVGYMPTLTPALQQDLENFLRVSVTLGLFALLIFLLIKVAQSYPFGGKEYKMKRQARRDRDQQVKMVLAHHLGNEMDRLEMSNILSVDESRKWKAKFASCLGLYGLLPKRALLSSDPEVVKENIKARKGKHTKVKLPDGKDAPKTGVERWLRKRKSATA